MRDQFRYTLKIGKSRAEAALGCFSHIFCFQFPMIAENWVFLRVTKIDTASHLRFPSLRLFPLAVFLRIIFPLFQPRLKCLNIFFVRIELSNDREQ